MIDTLNNTTDSRLCYRSPKIRVIEVKVHSVLCGSNDPMREYDYGDGGFGDA